MTGSMDGSGASRRIAAGERLGPYEIGEPLGEGGMGVVYRARDSRLDRPVAIKLLTGLDAAAPERRARFQREARSIAQLQHPNVCTLYDVGEHAGRDFLVMELLEGESLAERLTRGPLALPQVLAFGSAIAEALAAAHRRGILHRDLKPGNVMLTRSGPKLLDFGLAKLRAEVLAPVPDQATRTAAALTAEGTLVGTLAYMAPEQLEGKPADERADLWALGCVLHEMATGARAFPAATPASTIAAILEREPRPVSELAPLSPKAFDRLVRACLAKDPEARWGSAADLARELRWIEEGEATPTPGSGTSRRRPWRILAAAVAGLALGALVTNLWSSRARRNSGAAPRPAIRALLPVARPGVMPFTSVPAISPDGRRVVISAISTYGTAPLQLLTLEGEGSQPLVGTEGAAFAFWSPDSRSIAFFQGKRLKRLQLGEAGQDAKTVCAIEDQPRGGAWSRNGTILLSASRRGGLLQVPASGGTPVAATSLDAARGEQTHRWPQFLPDGERFLYWASTNEAEDHPAIRLGSLAGGPAPVLVEDTSNGILASGQLLYLTRTEGLVSQPFDPAGGRLSGARTTLSQDVYCCMGVSLAPISASDAGDLIYLPKPTTWNTSLGWYDRAGKALGSLSELAPWSAARLSPNGKRIAVTLTDLTPEPYRTDLWVLDLASGSRARLTFGEGDVEDPAWSPDGKRIAYLQYQAGKATIRVRSASGGAEELLLEENDIDDASLDWSPDSRTLAFQVFDGARGNYDLRALDIASRQARDLLATEADETSPRFSPDGRFLLYLSNESGNFQVYLRRLADGEKWQVSVDGGDFPRWTRSGREILFLGVDNRIRSVEVLLGPTIALGSPVMPPEARPFPVTRWFYFEPSPDGERILADAPPPETLDSKFRLIVNWPALLPH